MSESKRVEFKPPQDFQPPEGTEAGKKFDLVCSFEVRSDGSLCMTKLGNTDMPGCDGKDDDDGDKDMKHRPDYSNYSNGLMSQMGEGGAPAATSY